MQNPFEFFEMSDPTKQQAMGLLRVLNVQSRVGAKHIYGGTVSSAEKNRRRAKNRVARKSRRRNR